MKDVVRRFADLFAFLMLGYLAVDFVIGIGQLLVGGQYAGLPVSNFGVPLTIRLAQQVTVFLNIYVVLVVIAAVAAVTVFGVTRYARLVIFGGLGLLAVGFVLGVISVVGSLFIRGSYFTTRTKIEHLLADLVLLALFALVAFVLLQLSANPALTSATSGGPAQPGSGPQQGWPASSYAQPPWQPGPGGQPQQGGYGQVPPQQGGWPQQ